MMNALTMVYLYIESRVKAFLDEEHGAVDIVAVVVLIGIAVALAVIFKGRISTLLQDLLDKIGNNAKDVIQ